MKQEEQAIKCVNCGHEIESFSDELLGYEHSFFHIKGRCNPVEPCFCGCNKPKIKREGH